LRGLRGQYLVSWCQGWATSAVVTSLISSKASSGSCVSVKRHISEPPRKDGATALSLAGSVKATSLSASSGLSARMVAGTQEPVMNIGTVSWGSSASVSVSSQVFAAEVEGSCSSARSVYHSRPSTASG